MGTAISTGIGLAGMTGMIVGIGQSGYQSNKTASSLRAQIKDLNKQSEDWKKKYHEILLADYVLDSSMVKAMQDTLNNYIKLQSKIAIEKETFIQQYKQIQITGVIFITVIFFLLTLKQFDLLEPLFIFLNYPIIWAWNIIFNKN